MAARTRQPQGYRNFGSFFTDDVEQMVAMSVAEWKDPELPQVVAEARSGRPAVGELGWEMRRHFLLDFDNWTFINHGAFGATCQAAFREADAWRRHCEAQPLRFLDRQLFPHVVAVQRQLAQVVSCAPSDLVLQPNATTGLNAVFSSLAATAHIRRVFLLDIAYGSVKKMAQHLCRVANAELVVGHVPLPLGSSDDLLSLILDQIPRATDLVILDWVASNSALLLPLRQLIPACRERGVEYVVVDGAHALGQLPVDLTALGADFFVSNCHKWLCGSRGSAMLWVAPARKALVKPLVISHGSGRGFTSDFIWDGCRDYAPLLAVSAAIRFWHDVGFDRAVGYMRRLLAEATDLLVSAWSTGILAPLDCCGSMALVRLPEHLQISREGSRVPSSVEAKTMQDRLHHDYRIEVPVKCLADKLYVRVSVHVYNVLDDYRHLADVVKHMQP